MKPQAKQSASRKAVKRTIFIVVFAFVFYYLVLPTLARSRNSAELLSEVNPLLVALAVALEIGALLCYTVLTRVTLPDDPKLSLFTLFRIQLASRSVTNLVPGGSAAGSTLGFRLLTDSGVGNTAAGFTLATVGLGSAVILNLILWVALLISIPMNGFRTAYVTAAIVGVLLLAFAAGLVYLLIEGRQQAERVLRAIARRTPFVEEDTAARFVHQLADRIQDVAQQPELVRSGALWGTLNWLLDAAALWVFLMAFGTTLNPINLIVAFGVTNVLAAIPITPGGLGVVETALPSLLVTFGAPAQAATFAVLSWRLVQFWLPIPFGAVAYASLRLGPMGRRKRLAAVRSMAAEAGEHATEHVWDRETGEYRRVRPGEVIAAGAVTGEVVGTEPPDDEPSAQAKTG